MWDNKARAALAETFLNALKEDNIPWRKCWSGSQLSFSTGKPYRGINNLMLSFVANARGYKDTRWMTYKYAKDHGWQVRKDEKSVRVECWRYYDTKLKKNLDRSEVARIQREEPERMKDIRLAAYVYNVFNVEQIEGNIPPLEKKVQTDVKSLKAVRTPFFLNLGVAFQEGGDRAFYSPTSDMITLPPAEAFISDYAYMCTLLHEAGHATGHPDRLNRDMNGWFGSPSYAKEELRAEIASAFCAQELQLPLKPAELDFEIENHKAYIQSWIAILEKDPNELFAAIKDADKITDYLLEHGKLLELTAAAAIKPVPNLLSVRDLDRDQLDELKGRLFWTEGTDMGGRSNLSWEQLAVLESAQVPEEIPDEIVYSAYEEISFTPEDFTSFCGPIAGANFLAVEADYEPEL